MSNAADVAKSLQKSAKKIGNLPAGIVSDTALAAIEIADREGGTFFGGRARLFAEVKSTRNNKKSSSALVIGRPAAAWSMKSYGRRPVRPRRRTVLRGFTNGAMWFGYETAAMGPRSKGSWPQVEADTEAKFEGIADELMQEAING